MTAELGHATWQRMNASDTAVGVGLVSNCNCLCVSWFRIVDIIASVHRALDGTEQRREHGSHTAGSAGAYAGCCLNNS